MADGGFDPCECVWNHQMAMQRLLNMLRDSQSSCNDNECIQDMPGPQDPSAGGFNMMMMMMIGWLVVATALFLLRPQSLRRSSGDGKPRSGMGDRGGNPPAPPVQ